MVFNECTRIKSDFNKTLGVKRVAGATQNPETMDILSVAATAHNQKASFSPVKGGRIRKDVGFLTYEMGFSVAAAAHKAHSGLHKPPKGWSGKWWLLTSESGGCLLTSEFW